MPNIDLIALIAFSLINDSSNFFMRGSNSSDALMLARSGSVLILYQNGITQNSFMITSLNITRNGFNPR